MSTIQPVQGYSYNGTLYADEMSAVEAAVRDIGGALMKAYHANLGVGLIEQRDMILELLTSYERLTQAPSKDEVRAPGGFPIPQEKHNG